jgi:hypothetical protein
VEPRVELLWWEGCPSIEAATRLLREELEANGLDPDGFESIEIESDEQARKRSFVGSPTIRVDRHDVVDPGEQPPALNCRIYRHRNGRISPLPDRADVRGALRVALAGLGGTRPRGGQDDER